MIEDSSIPEKESKEIKAYKAASLFEFLKEQLKHISKTIQKINSISKDPSAFYIAANIIEQSREKINQEDMNNENIYDAYFSSVYTEIEEALSEVKNRISEDPKEVRKVMKLLCSDLLDGKMKIWKTQKEAKTIISGTGKEGIEYLYIAKTILMSKNLDKNDIVFTSFMQSFYKETKGSSFPDFRVEADSKFFLETEKDIKENKKRESQIMIINLIAAAKMQNYLPELSEILKTATSSIESEKKLLWLAGIKKETLGLPQTLMFMKNIKEVTEKYDLGNSVNIEEISNSVFTGPGENIFSLFDELENKINISAKKEERENKVFAKTFYEKTYDAKDQNIPIILRKMHEDIILDVSTSFEFRNSAQNILLDPKTVSFVLERKRSKDDLYELGLNMIKTQRKTRKLLTDKEDLNLLGIFKETKAFDTKLKDHYSPLIRLRAYQSNSGDSPDIQGMLKDEDSFVNFFGLIMSEGENIPEVQRLKNNIASLSPLQKVGLILQSHPIEDFIYDTDPIVRATVVTVEDKYDEIFKNDKSEVVRAVLARKSSRYHDYMLQENPNSSLVKESIYTFNSQANGSKIESSLSDFSKSPEDSVFLFKR